MINEGSLNAWFGKSKSKDGKKGWVQSDGSPCANEPGEKGTPKCYSSRRLAGLKKTKEGKSKIRSADSRKSRQDPGQQSKSGGAKPTMVRTFKDPKDYKKHKSGDYTPTKEEFEVQEAKDIKGSGSGTKDACYSKVKSRYSVWPSAYASGSLVKCRKVGAANWGNSTKKEEFEGFYKLPAFTESQIASMKYAGIEVEVIDEACWKGYTKKEEVTGGILVQDAGDFKPREIESVDIIKPEPIKGGQLQEVVRTKVQTGNMYQVIFGWRGKMMMVKLFFPDASVPNRQKVADALNKMYPGSQLRSYSMSIVDYDDPYINVGEETIKEEKKKGEKYCRLCEKRETRNKCAYGGKMWDKYSVNDVDDSEKGDAASDSGITESDDYNKDVQKRMDSQETSQQKRIQRKHRYSRFQQNKGLPAHQKEDYSNWRQYMQEDMSGMSQKSGDKRSTDSGAGMTAKGVAKYNRRTGGNLKTAVTTPPSKLKAGSKAAGRRKSFCARSKSWKGERGLAARRRWNCN